jgi:GDP-4-dehydro-6-deoxy-D-mannose reductase
MTSKALITGTAGLIGSYLAEALAERGDEIIATYWKPTIPLQDIAEQFDLIELDVRDYPDVHALIARTRPDAIYHLAAQSLPTVSWKDPWETMTSNVIGTINVFESVKKVRTAEPGYDPCVIVACSSAEYGASLTPERVPVDEEAPLLPLHPYGVSKMAQDLLTYQYYVNDGIRGVRARIFNCTGGRKQNDVVSDFAKRLVEATRQGTIMAVGNLETRRAIIDVRDMVAALVALAQRGRAGEAYNICAERVARIREILDLYFEVIGRKVPFEVDPKLLRPSDEPIIFGSTAKLRADTGWAPRIELIDTLRAVWEYELRRQGG